MGGAEAFPKPRGKKLPKSLAVGIHMSITEGWRQVSVSYSEADIEEISFGHIVVCNILRGFRKWCTSTEVSLMSARYFSRSLCYVTRCQYPALFPVTSSSGTAWMDLSQSWLDSQASRYWCRINWNIKVAQSPTACTRLRDAAEASKS